MFLFPLHLCYQIQFYLGHGFPNTTPAWSVSVSWVICLCFHLLFLFILGISQDFFIHSHRISAVFACLPIYQDAMFLRLEEVILKNQSMLLDPSFTHDCLPQDSSKNILIEFLYSGKTECYKICPLVAFPERNTAKYCS